MTLSTVLAQIQLAPQSNGGTDFSNLTTLSLEGMIAFAINAVLVVAAIAFFFMLILGGIKWILSGGDKGNTEAARNQVTAAIIGLVVVFSAWIILTFVLSIFGLSLNGLDFGVIT